MRRMEEQKEKIKTKMTSIHTLSLLYSPLPSYTRTTQIAGLESDELRRLLGEDEAVMKRRDDCERRLELLRTAHTEVSRVAGW